MAKISAERLEVLIRGGDYATSEEIRKLAKFYRKRKYPTVAASAPWIMWNGGDCPVARGTLIDVQFRNGGEEYRVPALESDTTTFLFWVQHMSAMDIVAYRYA